MVIDEMIRNLETREDVQILRGIEAYELPLLLRAEAKPAVVKQIINQELVANFHKVTGDLVKSAIAKRVEHGIAIKNLLTYADPVREIEKTNPDTLKESRMMPVSFRFDIILAVFRDFVAVTKLDAADCKGYVVRDELIAKSFESVFNVLWTDAEIV